MQFQSIPKQTTHQLRIHFQLFIRLLVLIQFRHILQIAIICSSDMLMVTIWSNNKNVQSEFTWNTQPIDMKYLLMC